MRPLLRSVFTAPVINCPFLVALLLMRHEVLQPGQAVFMPAGGLHAYLHGTGIELLANSDNVVRSGLTGKHIDVPELLRLLDPAVAVPVLSPRLLADGLATFDTPAPEFRLYLINLPPPSASAPAPARPGARPARHRPQHPALPRRHLHSAGRLRPGARPGPGRLLLHSLRRRPPPRHRPSPPSPSHLRHTAHPPLTPRRPHGGAFRDRGQFRANSNRNEIMQSLSGWRKQKGRASMKTSLLSAVGECVEAVRSAIPRLCA